MIILTIFLLIAALIVIIWVSTEIKHFKHKLTAVFLIGLILFFYFSMTAVYKGKDVELNSFSGLKETTGMYFSWLGGFFGNVKTITANAIHMDWSSDDEQQNETKS